MLKVEDNRLLREEIQRLKNLLEEKDEEIIQLRQILLPPEWEPPIELGLTPSEARTVAALYRARGETVSKEQLFYTLYHDRIDQPDIKIIDVFVCNFRKKLAKYGIEVVTVWGRGFRLDEKSVEIIKNWGLDPNDVEEQTDQQT